MHSETDTLRVLLSLCSQKLAHSLGRPYFKAALPYRGIRGRSPTLSSWGFEVAAGSITVGARLMV